ncbi:hypothetical protein Oter_0329 [Opitutus terrae PB90-1]|uniref:Uncharacterized protein n=1 Tax=Opitutus terrae (strain DSM 11246 / JCM 15787 / PB90-1) TaxID=452637 RepID=B1ZQD9_OPITP|nr:hypothetical protein Oter_0329 [Opitutus terrae PB90-1]
MLVGAKPIARRPRSDSGGQEGAIDPSVDFVDAVEMGIELENRGELPASTPIRWTQPVHSRNQFAFQFFAVC